MILEVNNTFDERRMYFLKGSDVDDPLERLNSDQNDIPSPIAVKNDEDVLNREIEVTDQATKNFKDTWAKDFHVSPFNSRKGSYVLSVSDPLRADIGNKSPIDNTITLYSSKEHLKLVAHVYSTGDAVDVSKLSRWDTFKFLASWCWVGFVTFPRIIREAGKLFFLRKLHVWYRPEVLKDSIGRQATNDEM